MRGGGSTFKQAFSVTYLSGSGDLGPVVNYFSILCIKDQRNEEETDVHVNAVRS